MLRMIDKDDINFMDEQSSKRKLRLSKRFSIWLKRRRLIASIFLVFIVVLYAISDKAWQDYQLRYPTLLQIIPAPVRGIHYVGFSDDDNLIIRAPITNNPMLKPYNSVFTVDGNYIVYLGGSFLNSEERSAPSIDHNGQSFTKLQDTSIVSGFAQSVPPESSSEIAEDNSSNTPPTDQTSSIKDESLYRFDIYNGKTGNLIRNCRDPFVGVSYLTYFDDDDIWISSKNDAILIDPKSFAAKKRLKGHTSKVTSLVSIPDSNLVVTGSYDNSARIWDLTTGRQLKIFSGVYGATEHVFPLISPNQVLTWGMAQEAVVWDAWTSKVICKLPKPKDGYAIDIAGNRFAWICNDAKYRLWDAKSYKLIAELNGDANTFRQNTWYLPVFSPNGKRIFTNGPKILIWNAQTGQRIGNIEESGNSVKKIEFSPSGNSFLTKHGDGEVRLWGQTRLINGFPHLLKTLYSNIMEAI